MRATGGKVDTQLFKLHFDTGGHSIALFTVLAFALGCSVLQVGMGVRAARGVPITAGDGGGRPRLSGTLGKASQLHPLCRTGVFSEEGNRDFGAVGSFGWRSSGASLVIRPSY